ncbi:MAG: hypothetical protein ABI467_04435 [Kofleriaceae bacterium]
MRWSALGLVIACVVACSNKEAPTAAPTEKPHHHEDRRDPQTAPTELAIAVAIAGKPSTTWTAKDFANVTKMPGKATDGQARDTWSLRELAHQLVGPTARVTAVIGEGKKVVIDAATWNATDKTPILHSTRRGTLKFRYADATGAWGDTIAKEVSGLEIQP